MLKKETIDKISTLLKIKPEDLTTAIADKEEVDVAIDDKLMVLTDTEKTTLEKNKYDEGKKAGVEMEVDKIKKEAGLDFQGKTVKGLVEAAQKKTLEDAKIPEAEKVKELQTKLEKVQSTATELEKKLTEKDAEVNSVKTQGLIVKDLPTNTTLPGDKVLLLMKADGYEYKNEDGKIVWYKDGKALTDKLGNNLATKDVATEYVTTNKLSTEEIIPPGGRGGGDKKPVGGFTKLSEVKKHFEDSGKSTLGSEFAEAVENAAKDNKEFVMD